MSVVSDIREGSGTRSTKLVTRENFEMDEEDIERLIEEQLPRGSKVTFSWSRGLILSVYVEVVTEREEQ